MINPILTREEAAKSLAPLIDFAEKIKAEGMGEARLIVTEFPTFGSFIKRFTSQFVAVRLFHEPNFVQSLTALQSAGKPLALASRLVSKDNFKTPERQQELVSGLLAADEATPGLIILISAPASVPSQGKTSVTEAWRNSLYHITVVSLWNWNSTKEEIAGHYAKASGSIENLRRITPHAAYLVGMNGTNRDLVTDY